MFDYLKGKQKGINGLSDSGRVRLEIDCLSLARGLLRRKKRAYFLFPFEKK
jgi:hypothetical protein